MKSNKIQTDAFAVNQQDGFITDISNPLHILAAYNHHRKEITLLIPNTLSDFDVPTIAMQKYTIIGHTAHFSIARWDDDTQTDVTI